MASTGEHFISSGFEEGQVELDWNSDPVTTTALQEEIQMRAREEFTFNLNLTREYLTERNSQMTAPEKMEKSEEKNIRVARFLFLQYTYQKEGK
jgi:hypothetical protein